VSPRPYPVPPVPTPSSTAEPAPPTASPPAATPALVTIIPTPQGGITEEWKQAVRLFQIGNATQSRGLLGEAVQAYQLSIRTHPTAEAYTFLAWTFSWMNQYETAIDEAKKAIALDPDYGNPYNDIGSYLIDLGRIDEAMEARRYTTPHFPHLNLADVWIQKEQWRKALGACERALLLVPDQPLPMFPTRMIGLTGPFEMRIDPSRASEVPAVQAAIASYLDAWNRHDAGAVIGVSDLGSHAVAKAVILHLAKAKLQALALTIEDVQVVHLDGDEAIVDVSLGPGARPSEVSYLLVLVEESWKVGPVIIDMSPKNEPVPPPN
jgi:tetratricopeptide (TPR) repeat protein